MTARSVGHPTILIEADVLLPALAWLRLDVVTAASKTGQVHRREAEQQIRAYCASTPLRPGTIETLTRLQTDHSLTVISDFPADAIANSLRNAGLSEIRTESFALDGQLAASPSIELLALWLEQLTPANCVGAIAVGRPLVAAAAAAGLRLLPWERKPSARDPLGLTP